MGIDINNLNPLLFGLIAGIITYIVLYFDYKFENKKYESKNVDSIDGKCSCPSLMVTLKLPLIIGIIVWGTAYYFEKINKCNVIQPISLQYLTDSTSVFDEQDVFTDMPEF